jgi:ADP-heptose:LPS heptosyltransferase
VLAPVKVSPIFSLMPEISEVITIPNTLIDKSGVVGLISQLRKRQFSSAFQLTYSRRARAILALLHIEHRHPYRPELVKRNTLLGPSSDDFAAILLNLSSTSELPITLPNPALRADANWQRTTLAKWRIQTILTGTADQQPRLAAAQPLFLLGTDHQDRFTSEKHAPASLYASLIKRWPNARVMSINREKMTMNESTYPIDLVDKMALISAATAVVSDNVFTLQLSDAFCTPAISLLPTSVDVPRHWTSRQGRFAAASAGIAEIVQNLEKILRFDRQYHLLS